MEKSSKQLIIDSLLQQGLISQKDAYTLMCDAFKTQMSATVSIAAVDNWLRRIGYFYSMSQDSFIKQYYDVVRGTFSHGVTVQEIQTDPRQVVLNVKDWHENTGILLADWPWDSEETRKINIDEFYGVKDTCAHEKGSTPLINERNELWIICKKCGKDLELVKK